MSSTFHGVGYSAADNHKPTLFLLQSLQIFCSYESYAAQARLPAIQGTGGVFFAGAWASYGFHEDGIKAGVAAARLLGAEVPWGSGIATSPKMGLTDMLWLALFDRSVDSGL